MLPSVSTSLQTLLIFPVTVFGSVCKVRTQDPENFDEEVKSLVTAWLMLTTSSSKGNTLPGTVSNRLTWTTNQRCEKEDAAVVQVSKPV